MSKKIKKEVKEAVRGNFTGYSLLPTVAPQGSNNFSCNVLIQNDEGTTFLIKVIELGKLSPDTLEQTFDSIKAAEELKSPFFVPLLEARKTEEYVFLMFPFLEGGTLSEYAGRRKGVFSEKELKEIGISLLRGIADFSRAEIVHQDIKPDNIFVTALGEIKILDFGSSRYRKSNFHGSTRTSRSYSSPEQIYAVKPVNLELLRLTCDERSDVYSVGVILYELCTGHLPFATNDEKLKGNITERINRGDISDGFKKIVFRLLNLHPRNRPSATEASSFFETGEVSEMVLPRGGFYYGISSSVTRFKKAASFDETLFDGIVARASRIPFTDFKYLSSGPVATIIDPETYLFQAPAHINKKFKKLPYYKYGLLSGAGNVDINNVDTANPKPFISDVFRHEISLGTDVLMPPFFLIKETNDISWTLDQQMANSATGVYSEETMQLPLFKGVAISSNVLTTEATRGKVLDYLTSPALKKYSGYYIILENNNSAEVLTSGDWLVAARKFIIQLLATGKTVIWGQCSLAGIIFSGQPGLSIAIGENQSQRNFYLPDQKGKGRKGPSHIYAPNMFSRIKWPIESTLRGSGEYDEMVCNEKCCEGIDFSNPAGREEADLATHFVFRLGQQFKKYSEGGIALARVDMEHARSIFNTLKASPDLLVRKAVLNEIKPSTTTFLDILLDTFR